MQDFVDKFKKQFPDREIIFLCKAGSHFFDLATENSDQDFRGVYLPSPKEIYEGESRRAMVEFKTQSRKTGVKNTADDIDFTLFSITKFLKLLSSGDFNVMEMLHTPEDKIIINSGYFQSLMDFRQNLLVNDISAFLGFIKKEYKRYGINIYHYQAQENLLKFLNKFHEHTRLSKIWSEIEDYAQGNPHITFTTSSTGNHTRVPTIKIAQRLHQNTVTVGYVRQAIEHNLSKYGHRQKSMAKSGVEYKGLYHALRLIYEANDLFDFGEFRLPFSKERHEKLMNIKTGNVQKDELFGMIDSEIEKLYQREKTCISNRDVVQYRINKLLFQLEGSERIKYLLRR